MTVVPHDIIVQLNGPDQWVLYNVFTRNALAVTTNALQVLSSVARGSSDAEIAMEFSGTRFLFWEIGFFSNTYGLLADPTGMTRDRSAWSSAKDVDVSELMEALEKRRIIVRDENGYRAQFAPKTSLLDREHLGNFHERLGQELFVGERTNPAEWWVFQKFTPDLRDLRNTLYKTVQGDFLDALFRERFRSEHSIIDLGCGTGFYAKKMGETGATVLGVDPSERYVQIAERESCGNVSFRISKIGVRGALDWIPDHSADFIFMSDALLFYFVSPDPRSCHDIAVLFNDIQRILKPSGRFFSLEPHGIFWLAPWLGEEERPFTILTEYRNKKFGVAPNCEQMVRAFLDGGFTLRTMKEIYASRDLTEDARASAFSREYPLWWFFELSHGI